MIVVAPFTAVTSGFAVWPAICTTAVSAYWTPVAERIMVLMMLPMTMVFTAKMVHTPNDEMKLASCND